MSSSLSELNENYISLIIVIIGFSLLACRSIYTPIKIKRDLENLKNFQSQKLYVGYTSGIALDFVHHKIAYHNRYQIQIFESSDIHDFIIIFGPFLKEDGTPNGARNQVIVKTNLERIPKFSVQFLSTTKTEKCEVSLRNWFSSQELQIPTNSISDSPGVILEDKHEELKKSLVRLLDEHGFSKESPEIEINRASFNQACALLFSDYERRNLRKIPRGEKGEVIEEVLKPYFEDNASRKGFSASTIGNYVSEEKMSWEASQKREERRKVSVENT